MAGLRDGFHKSLLASVVCMDFFIEYYEAVGKTCECRCLWEILRCRATQRRLTRRREEVDQYNDEENKNCAMTDVIQLGARAGTQSKRCHPQQHPSNGEGMSYYGCWPGPRFTGGYRKGAPGKQESTERFNNHCWNDSRFL